MACIPWSMVNAALFYSVHVHTHTHDICTGSWCKNVFITLGHNEKSIESYSYELSCRDLGGVFSASLASCVPATPQSSVLSSPPMSLSIVSPPLCIFLVAGWWEWSEDGQ